MSSDSALSDVPDDESVLSSDGSDNPIAARRARLPSSRHNQPSPSDPSSVRKKKAAASAQGKAWEGGFERTWDSVREDERGTLQGAVNEEMLGGKTRRVVRDTTSIQRGIIRHVYLVIDLSMAMLVREFKATWLDITIQYAKEFVTEFFDQNPISQLAILVTRDGAAERLSVLSGNPVDHLRVLNNKKKLEPKGEPSLQNVLDMARAGLSHLPPHGSREVIIVLGSLTTCDPGNIHKTIAATEADRVRVSVLGLSAEMKICKDIATRTKGTYAVAKDDLYFRDLLFDFIPPPPTVAPSKALALGGPGGSAVGAGGTGGGADLMMMGFPALVQAPYPGLCACHGRMRSSGYACPRCKSRLCDVPTECRVCSLTVVSSPHLARSYRHLFPVDNFEIVSSGAPTDPPTACFACAFPFPTAVAILPPPDPSGTGNASSLSALGRYACKACRNQFCLDCDVLVHGALGFCPGCV